MKRLLGSAAVVALASCFAAGSITTAQARPAPAANPCSYLTNYYCGSSGTQTSYTRKSDQYIINETDSRSPRIFGALIRSDGTSYNSAESTTGRAVKTYSAQTSRLGCGQLNGNVLIGCGYHAVA